MPTQSADERSSAGTGRDAQGRSRLHQTGVLAVIAGFALLVAACSSGGSGRSAAGAGASGGGKVTGLATEPGSECCRQHDRQPLPWFGQRAHVHLRQPEPELLRQPRHGARAQQSSTAECLQSRGVPCARHRDQRRGGQGHRQHLRWDQMGLAAAPSELSQRRSPVRIWPESVGFLPVQLEEDRSSVLISPVAPPVCQEFNQA